MKDSKGSIRDALQTIREGNSIVAEGKYSAYSDLLLMKARIIDKEGPKSDKLPAVNSQIKIVLKRLGIKEDMDVDVESIEEAPKPAQMKKLGFYGSEIGGLRQGNKYYVAKPVDVKGKVGFRVTDEFGAFETIDLKTFAKRFG